MTIRRQSKSVRFILLVLLVIVCTLLYQPNLGRVTAQDECNTGTSTPRAIEGASAITIEPLWGMQVAIGNFQNRSIAAGTGEIYISKLCSEIIALDWTTGTVNWVATGFQHEASALTLNRQTQTLYFSALEQVGALSVADGEILWLTHTPLFERTSHVPQIMSDDRLIVYIDEHSIYAMDARTGAMQEELDIPPHTLLYTEDAIIQDTGSGLRVMRYSENDPDWVIDGRWRGWLFRDAILLYQDENLLLVHSSIIREDNPEIVTIEWDTGAILWEFDETIIVSNVLYDEGRVFFLDAHARLWILDSLSGAVLASVQFTPPSDPDSYDVGTGIGNSYVAINDSLILIYFHDTDTLSVYRFEITTSP